MKPAPLKIGAVSEEIVRVQFDAPIEGIAAYLDPDSYIFTEGLETLGVVVVQPDTVDVLTTPQETDHFYQLKMDHNA